MAAYRYRRAFVEQSNPDVPAFMKSRIDDFMHLLEGELQQRTFIAGDGPAVADLSMTGYLVFPPHESGYDFAMSRSR